MLSVSFWPPDDAPHRRATCCDVKLHGKTAALKALCSTDYTEWNRRRASTSGSLHQVDPTQSGTVEGLAYHYYQVWNCEGDNVQDSLSETSFIQLGTVEGLALQVAHTKYIPYIVEL